MAMHTFIYDNGWYVIVFRSGDSQVVGAKKIMRTKVFDACIFMVSFLNGGPVKDSYLDGSLFEML